MNKTLLSLDISSSMIGLARFDYETKKLIGARFYKQDKKLKHPERISNMIHMLFEPMQCKYDIVVLEKPIGKFNNTHVTITLSLYIGAAIAYFKKINPECKVILMAASEWRGLLFNKFGSMTREEEKMKMIEWVNERYDLPNGKLEYDKNGLNGHDDIADSIGMGFGSYVFIYREGIIEEYKVIRKLEDKKLKRRNDIIDKTKEYKELFGLKGKANDNWYEQVIDNALYNSQHPLYSRKMKLRKYVMEIKEVEQELAKIRDKAKVMLTDNQWLNSKKKGT